MNYARARLWLGITSVGSLVVLSAAALLFDLPQRVFPAEPRELTTEVLALTAAFGAYVLVSMPFDLLGGLVLPRRFGRSVLRLGPFVRMWMRGVIAQGLWFVALALAVMIVARSVSSFAALTVAALGMVLLVAAQGAFARWVGGLRTAADPRAFPTLERPVLLLDARDEGFTGTWIGLPGREVLALPAHWVRSLDEAELAAQLTRRRFVWRNGARARGLALAATFNLVGLAVLIYGFGIDPSQVAGLVSIALGSTLWSFLGALVLPSLSRPAVYAADRAALEQGCAVDLLAGLARRLDRWQDDEPRRAPAVETIFHPIPAVEHRVDALRDPRTVRSGAWHTARVALWLSWACFGLLGRAVHCNCGRPELWVMLPAD